ncbi:serine/threonine protein kinase [Paenibacillus sedimenti]|uniref:Protein kinase n=1 Tax=Paenibacillus sedimenti TaxID=2770274 RepID=A0A926KKZ2_9BACL|nr:protein kinase [Paenibacillus sedimenti]MBD0378901.1 protein kinase [Paenibacillus sedimenti]
MSGYFKRVYEAWIDYPQRVGKVLAGQYRIERFLGIGSYGLTYLCQDVQSGEEIVLKQAKPSKGRLGQELLRREIEIMGQLNHRSIPRCLASFEEQKRLYMVTEYVKGQTVEELIFERGALFTEKEAFGIVRKLMEIVCYVHDKGFVHLDIRIPNVILQGERISLIDFGLASRLGEPAHIDPGADMELARRRKVEVSSDLYAIGHFILFMLYSAFEPKVPGVEASGGWEEELEVSPNMKKILRKLLQIDPTYVSAQAFIVDLDAALND